MGQGTHRCKLTKVEYRIQNLKNIALKIQDFKYFSFQRNFKIWSNFKVKWNSNSSNCSTVSGILLQIWFVAHSLKFYKLHHTGALPKIAFAFGQLEKSISGINTLAFCNSVIDKE